MGNELDLGGLVMRIRADATGVLEGARQLEAAMNQMRTSSDKAGTDIEKAATREVAAVQGAANATTQAAQQMAQGNKQMAQSAEESSAVQAAAYAGVAAMAAKMIGAVINAIDKGIEAQNRYINSMKGLQSVGDGRGIGSQELQGALDGLTDSFFDASAAATSLKNLLTRGYTLDQAIDTITRLKDSAAFGRQANLSLAQAVQTATEGIRNENSILVDNAGVTKNVAKMWEDYAKARGIATTSLTQAQKVEAEYQGIMQETAMQVGDLSKLTDTLAGSQAKAAQSSELLSRSYGEEMAPAISLLTNGMTTFQDTLRGVVDTFPGLTAGLSAGGVALMALVVTIPAASIALKKLKADFAEATASATIFRMSLKTAMPLMAGISALILAGTWAWTAYKNAQEAAAKKEAEAAQKREENIRKASQTSAELVKLADRYDELSKKQKLTYTEMKELKVIEEALSSQHTTTGEAVAKLTEKYDNLGKAAKAAAEEEFNFSQGQLYEQMIADLDAVTAAMADYKKEQESLKSAQEILALPYNEQIKFNPHGFITADPAAYEASFVAVKTALTKWFASSLTRSAADAVHNGASQDAVDLIGKDLSEQFAAMLDSADFDPTQGGGGAFVDTMKAILKSFASVTSSPEYSAAVEVMSEIKDKYINGISITSEDETRLQAAVDTLANFGGDVLAKLSANGLNDADANAWADNLIDILFGPFKDGLSATGRITSIVREFNDAVKRDLEAVFDNAASEEQTAMFDKVAKSVTDLTNNFKDLATELSNMQTAQGALDWLSENGSQAEGAKEMIALVEQYTELTVASNDDISQAYRYTGAEIDRLIKRHEELNVRADEIIGTYERMSEKLGTDATQAMELLANASVRADDALQSVIDQDLNNLKADFVGLGATIESLSARLQTTTKRAENLKEIKKIMSENARGTAEWNRAMALMGLSTSATAEEAKQAVSDMESSLKAESTSIQDALNAAYNDLLAFVEAANAHPELNIDTSPAMAAIQALFAPLNNLLGLMGMAKVKTGGGGGGTSRYQKDVASIDHESSMDRMSLERELAALEALDAKYRNRKGRSTLKLADQRDLEKRIYEAQEAIRQKDLDDAYDLIDHKKALNQLSLQEELAMLEAIKGAHKLNAEELLDIEERLYDVKESVRQGELQAELDLYSHQKNMGELTVQQEIDTLERIKAAHQLNQQELWSLEEQLYALRKQLQDETTQVQEDALSTQSSAIQKAYNKITQALKNRLQEEKNAELKALDDKIAILQAETAAENEAAREQDYETKLAEKQRQLQITKSARERRALQAEIDNIIADEQLRQVQAARQAEIDALRDQKTAVNDKYADLMSEENLRQEALRMVMSNNLQQMADLIASYGSVWEDAGASLADYLTKGITDGKTGILATLEGLVNGMNNAVERQFQQIANSIPDVRAGGIQINMNGLTVREEADVKRIAEAIMEEVERKSR